MVRKPASPFGDLNHVVFWPPFLLLVAAVFLNVTSPEKFETIITDANGWVLNNFGWLFTVCAFMAVMLCVLICFSQFANVRIGGMQAKPLMSYWNWFSITICTTIAIGILFWSTAEPIFHYTAPPESLEIAASSPASAKFALSTMFLHWSFTPYSIYAVASLMFAFAYYNMQKPFSLSSTLTPIFASNSLSVSGRSRSTW